MGPHSQCGGRNRRLAAADSDRAKRGTSVFESDCAGGGRSRNRGREVTDCPYAEEEVLDETLVLVPAMAQRTPAARRRSRQT